MTVEALKRAVARRELTFGLHGEKWLAGRGLTVRSVYEALTSCELLEPYDEGERVEEVGPSALVVGVTAAGMLPHIACAVRGGRARLTP